MAIAILITPNYPLGSLESFPSDAVMPWFSPKAGVDTGDFETMLAVFHLNAGATKGRAYCLPAIQQGDQNTLGIFFAHHQREQCGRSRGGVVE